MVAIDANIIAWMGKTLRRVKMTQKSSTALRKRCRFRVELHMCTMMQNHCIMCIHGIPKMSKIKRGQKKCLLGTQMLSLA